MRLTVIGVSPDVRYRLEDRLFIFKSDMRRSNRYEQDYQVFDLSFFST
jgi:hypothetical protein